MTEASAGSAAGAFTGAHGRRIVRFHRPCDPAATPRAAIVIAHGFGEHFGRYAAVSDMLAGRGFDVYGLDHHGHGESGGRRARVSLRDAVADLDQVVLWAQRTTSGRPVFLLGHSMGGAIALRYAMAHGDRLRGLVLSAPVTQIEPRASRRVWRQIVGAARPGAEATAIDPAWLSRDSAVVEAYRADPMVFHGGVPATTSAELIRHGATLMRDAASISVPTLLAYGGEDPISAPAEAILSGGMPSDLLTVSRWPPLRHEILNEPERAEVVGVIVAWMVERLPVDAAG